MNLITSIRGKLSPFTCWGSLSSVPTERNQCFETKKKKENIEKDTKTLDWIYKLRKHKVQSRKLNDLCPFICYLFKSVLIRSPLVVSNGNPSKLVEGNKKAENYIDSLNTCTWLLENQTMGKRSLQESTTSM